MKNVHMYDRSSAAVALSNSVNQKKNETASQYAAGNQLHKILVQNVDEHWMSFRTDLKWRNVYSFGVGLRNTGFGGVVIGL